MGSALRDLLVVGPRPQQPFEDMGGESLGDILGGALKRANASQEDPLWLQSATAQVPDGEVSLGGPGLTGYEQYSPADLAAMRMQRGARVPSRYQPPMPPGMTAAETGDTLYRAAFGQPDATIPQALTRPPSTWTPEEQDLIYGGTTNAALMATPAAMTRPIASAAGTVMDIARAAPKTSTGALAAGGVMLTGTEAAERAGEQRSMSSQYGPEIEQLKKRIQDNENKVIAASSQNIPAPSGGRNQKERDAAQRRWEAASNRVGGQIHLLNEAIRKDRDRLGEVQGLQGVIEKEARDAEARGRPLVEQHPWVKYGPVVGGVIAGATAMDPRVRAVSQYNQLIKNMLDKVPAVEAAAARTGNAVTNADRVAVEQLRAYMAAHPGALKGITPSLGKEVGGMASAAVPGAAVGAELGMLPSQIDLVSQGKDTPAYQAALDRFTTLPGWAKTGLNAFVGMTGGSLGAGAPTSWVGARPGFADLPRAQGAMTAYEQRAALGASGRGAPGPASPTPQSPSPRSSQAPYFDRAMNRWRDPTTGHTVAAPKGKRGSASDDSGPDPLGR